MRLQELITELNSRFRQRNFFIVMGDIEILVFKNPQLLKKIDFEAGSKLLRIVVRDWVLYPRLIKSIINYEDCLNPLQQALIRSNIKLAESLLKNGVKPEGPEWFVDSLVKCLFWRKNIYVRKDMLVLFIKYGLDTGFKNFEGENLLNQFIRFVSQNDQDAVEIAEILIKSGNLVNEVDKDGGTPFLKSIDSGNLLLLSFLIENGAHVNHRPESGDIDLCPLIIAAQYNNKNLIELLIQKGADVNYKIDGWTALHEACCINSEQAISILLQKGANLNAEDNDGSTPFSLLDPERDYNYNICLKTIVKEFARLNFESLPISRENVELIQGNLKARKYFDLCTIELNKMSNTVFYASYSYNFVFKASKNNFRKLVHLTKNKEFVEKFKSNLKLFFNYKNDLQRIFNEAIRVKNELLIVEARLITIFENFFPVVVIKVLADNLSVKDLPL